MAKSPGQRGFPLKKRARVAVVFPTTGIVDAFFTRDLAVLVGYNSWMAAKEDYPVEAVSLTMRVGTYIADARNSLAEKAVEEGHTHILWLDSDMRFPKDTITRLLARDKPIVGANYCTRMPPHKFNAHTVPGMSLKTFDDSTGLEAVSYVGFGCILVQTDVFLKVPQPWFEIPYIEESNDFMGEDVSFCKKAIMAGYEVLVDHDLTKLVSHSGRMEYNYIHALDSMAFMEEVEEEKSDGTDNDVCDTPSEHSDLVESV